MDFVPDAGKSSRAGAVNHSPGRCAALRRSENCGFAPYAPPPRATARRSAWSRSRRFSFAPTPTRTSQLRRHGERQPRRAGAGGRDHLRALVRRTPIIATARRDPGGQLDACLSGDFPDAGGTDATDLSGNGGCIGIADLSAFFFREFLSWHGRVTGLGLRNTLRPHRRPDSESGRR
jgi:hypothetical protein